MCNFCFSILYFADILYIHIYSLCFLKSIVDNVVCSLFLITQNRDVVRQIYLSAAMLMCVFIVATAIAFRRQLHGCCGRRFVEGSFLGC